MNDMPYDCTDSDNPYLINTNQKEQIIGPEGKQLSAEYIWSKCGQEREELVDWVFNYYRENGFPSLQLPDKTLKNSLNSIKKIKPNSVLNNEGYIKNTSSTGTNIIKHFCGSKYYGSKLGKSNSTYDVFNNDDLLTKVLKNRMGWCQSGEDGVKRPYVFGITDKMILQGIRSSGLSINVSQFKPAVAKFLYNKYVPEGGSVWDYSAGWGARLLGAMSLGLEYYGTDPHTYKDLNSMLKFFGGKGKIFNKCSEDNLLLDLVPTVDFVMSSPPYFNLEIYCDELSQSYNQYQNYNDWLENYWKATVYNSINLLKENGKFCFIAVEKVGKMDLYQDMLKICIDLDLVIDEELYFKTSNSHLSGKRKTKKTTKITEKVCVLNIPSL